MSVHVDAIHSAPVPDSLQTSPCLQFSIFVDGQLKLGNL